MNDNELGFKRCFYTSWKMGYRVDWTYSAATNHAGVIMMKRKVNEIKTQAHDGTLPEALAPFVVTHQYGSDMLSVTEAAERLKVSSTTVYNWVDDGVLLAWKSAKRGLTIPAEQMLGHHQVVPGLRELLAIIGGAELTWEFLTNDWPFAASVARPIDKLKAGDVEDVLGAAPSYGTAFT